MRIETHTPHADSMIQVAAVSDLFFNYEHPNRDKLYAPPPEQRSFTEEEKAAALLEDARNFASTLLNATGLLVTPEDLVRDYLNRE